MVELQGVQIETAGCASGVVVGMEEGVEAVDVEYSGNLEEADGYDSDSGTVKVWGEDSRRIEMAKHSGWPGACIEGPDLPDLNCSDIAWVQELHLDMEVV
jgi:hypothetical protein